MVASLYTCGRSNFESRSSGCMLTVLSGDKQENTSKPLPRFKSHTGVLKVMRITWSTVNVDIYGGLTGLAYNKAASMHLSTVLEGLHEHEADQFEMHSPVCY